MSEEEIRLIKGYFNDGYCCDLDELKEIANKMIDLLQQKENIIKEAREYAKEHIRIDDEYPDYMEMLIEEYDKLLEILGRENNDKRGI